MNESFNNELLIVNLEVRKYFVINMNYIISENIIFDCCSLVKKKLVIKV